MADEQTPSTNTHRALATVVIAGLGVFLYQAAGVLQKIQTWEVIWNPPTVGDLLMAVVAGLAAVAAAAGLDVGNLMRGLGLSAGSPNININKGE